MVCDYLSKSVVRLLFKKEEGSYYLIFLGVCVCLRRELILMKKEVK